MASVHSRKASHDGKHCGDNQAVHPRAIAMKQEPTEATRHRSGNAVGISRLKAGEDVKADSTTQEAFRNLFTIRLVLSSPLPNI
jgi:hypothetical protein